MSIHNGSRRSFLLASMGLAATNLVRAQSAQALTAGQVIDRIKANVGIPWRAQTVDNIIAGSARVAMIASRLLPMPPNADPASSPARIRKNVPRARRYTSAMMLPAKLSGVWERNTGINRPAATVDANTMYGAAVKIQEVDRKSVV